MIQIFYHQKFQSMFSIENCKTIEKFFNGWCKNLEYGDFFQPDGRKTLQWILS